MSLTEIRENAYERAKEILGYSLEPAELTESDCSSPSGCKVKIYNYPSVNFFGWVPQSGKKSKKEREEALVVITVAALAAIIAATTYFLGQDISVASRAEKECELLCAEVEDLSDISNLDKKIIENDREVLEGLQERHNRNAVIKTGIIASGIMALLYTIEYTTGSLAWGGGPVAFGVLGAIGLARFGYQNVDTSLKEPAMDTLVLLKRLHK